MGRKRLYTMFGLTLVVACVCILIIVAISATEKTQSDKVIAPTAKAPTEYVRIPGNMYTGVKVYYGRGDKKTYGFEIVGVSKDCPSMPSGLGVKVLYESGKQEWKDRDFILDSEDIFVKSDDPAITKAELLDLTDCK